MSIWKQAIHKSHENNDTSEIAILDLKYNCKQQWEYLSKYK